MPVSTLESASCRESFKGDGIADFLNSLMEQHEKNTWMLRSQLETAEAEAS